MAVLGVDFGTSNSAAGVARDGAPHLIALEKDEKTLPTAVFFDFEKKRMLIGTAAGKALLAGEEGRYMRALKSLLGAPLMREKRNLLGEKLDFIDIVARFLAQVKRGAEAQTGERFDRALSGRPVRFHGDETRNAQAEVDLREAYLRAGFDEVAFMYEPEAAALANRALLDEGDLGLIVDIGGGTSDFTLFRNGVDGIEISASHGIRSGGTDFDRTLSLETVMPLLGRGSEIRHAFGNETHTAPATIFNDLATWQKIQFLYAPDSRRLASDLAQYAVEPDKLARLVSVLADELGHDIAFAVEAGKIAANISGAGVVDLQVVERGLSVSLESDTVGALLRPMAEDMAAAALATVARADVAPEDVTHLVFVGGSSLMRVTRDALGQVFPQAAVHHGSALTAIVDGLGIAAEGAFD
ncbi:Hsp70 family protein [Sulfitobacter sp. F26169L]|uniref:Hsp70 family protein n=1 Tax=Sulfitobacter sp. F26169L TaxID=2996015 RepID=UPI0022609FA9|nr:Hsp70 family protein [Sulfitobacter sp. F26169L]MCX7566570.1 Hsp70 family protein [Sulfitobacter sp. F26169L]